MNTCPNCGGPLLFLENANAVSAPWLCDGCSRAWWPAELSLTARSLWNERTRSRPPSVEAVLVEIEMTNDRDQAIKRAKSGKKPHVRGGVRGA